jgi:hypothetical protein
MADINPQDINAMLTHLSNISGSMNKLVKASDGDNTTGKKNNDLFKGVKDGATDFGKSLTILGNGAKRFALHLEQNTTNMSGSFKQLKAATESTGGIFTKTAATFVTAGAMIGVAIEQSIKQTFQNYQALRSVGQTFNGSLMQLSLAAAQARLPLGEFADLIKKNSQAAATLGAQGLGQWSRGLRESLKDVGELGMSTSDLNDVVGNYTQTLSLFGRLQNTSTSQAVSSMRDLAIESSALAAVSGKNRMDLLKDANTALQSATLRSAAITQEGNNSQAVIQASTKAVMFLSSLPGEAGKALSGMLADTIGSGGAYMTQAVKDFTNAGLYGVANMMDQMANKIKSGQDLSPEDEAKFYQDFLAQGKANMATLNLQAQAGNQSAIKAIAMIKDMENQAGNFSADNIRKQREQAQMQTAATKAISNLEEIFKEVSGAIRETFLKTIIAWSETPAFATLVTNFKALGAQAEQLFSRVFTPENLTKLGNAVFWIGEKLISGVSLAAEGLTKVVSVVNKLVEKFGVLGTVAGALALYFGTKYLAKKYKETKEASRQRVAIAEGMSQALGRYGNGSALRTTGPGGASYGNAIEAAEDELHGTGSRVPRGARWRRAGRRAGQRVGGFMNNLRALPSNIRNTVSYGVGAARLGARNLMRNPGRLVAGASRFGGLAAAAGGAALDLAPDFKGKETLSNALSMGGLGAQIGSMFGPLGTLIGGGVGALAGIIISNWDPIKTALGKALDWVGGALSKVFGWFKTAFKFTPLGAAITLFNSIRDNGFTATWDAIKTNIGGFFDSLGNVFSSIGDWLSSKFTWLKNFDVFGIMKKAILALPGGSLLVKAFDSAVGNTSGPSTPSTSTTATPNVEVANLQNLVNTLQKQNADMQRQMASTNQIMMKMLEALNHGNAQERAIAQQANDAMKKMGSNLDPNRA